MSRHGPDADRLSPQQQLTVEYMQMAGRRSNVHGLVEVDVGERIEQDTLDTIGIAWSLRFDIDQRRHTPPEEKSRPARLGHRRPEVTGAVVTGIGYRIECRPRSN